MEMREWIPLTPEQQQFAAEHHGLLLKFMGTHGLDDDYYGIMAERYVKTVKKYMETESLHQYAFSTILWYRLRSDLFKIRKRIWKESANRALDETEEVIAFSENLDTPLLWSEIEKNVTQRQLQLLKLRALGFTPKEIAQMQNCTGNAIHCRFRRIKKKLKGLDIL